MRWAAMRAGAFVGVSPATCNTLAAELAIPVHRICCVPNGVPMPVGDREQARNELELGINERLILAVGNLYPVKGHRVLVEAAGLLAAMDDLPSWRIAIAGRGDEEAPLKARIADLRLDSRLQLLGLRSDIGDLLAAADLWVMPSLSEGLPMALLEAMFAGLPVIASNVGGIPAVIEDSVNGALVPPSNPIALVARLADFLRAPVAAKELGERARMKAQQEYSVRRMAERYVALYSNAIAG
jgi:glycosyltransferase involved in cell wall biosynthesis